MTESLPKSWTMTTLGEIADTTKRRVRPQDHPDKPYIGMEHIEAHTMRLLGTVPAKEMRSTAESFSAGDVLYGRLRPYLNKVYCPDFDGLCSTEFIPFRKNNVVESKFLQYFLNSSEFMRFAAHLNEGDRPRVDFNQLKDYPMPLPPKEIQKKIVAKIEELFSQLDAATAALKRVQANLKRYKASVLKAACEGRLVPTEAELARREGRSYESGAELLERILKERRRRWEEEQRAKGKDPAKMKYPEPAMPDTEGLPELPEGWVWASLEQLTSAVRVICYGILMPKEHVPDGVPYVKVKDFKNEVIEVEKLQKTSPLIAKKYERASLRYGDILLAIRGTFGRVATVPQSLEGGNITQDTARLDPSQFVSINYLTTLLRSPLVQTYFKKVARGVAVKGVNIADVRTTPIPLPPLSDQERIVGEVEERLSIVQCLIEDLNSYQKKASLIRQSILKSAFEGALVTN